MNEVVLIVDDEENILSALTRELRGFLRARGLESATAGSAAQALDYLGREGPRVAVLLTDQKMPAMSGLELAREVAARFPKVGILLLSGHAEIEELDEGSASILVASLMKPWSGVELEKRIDEALAAHAGRVARSPER